MLLQPQVNYKLFLTENSLSISEIYEKIASKKFSERLISLLVTTTMSTEGTTITESSLVTSEPPIGMAKGGSGVLVYLL